MVEQWMRELPNDFDDAVLGKFAKVFSTECVIYEAKLAFRERSITVAVVVGKLGNIAQIIHQARGPYSEIERTELESRNFMARALPEFIVKCGYEIGPCDNYSDLLELYKLWIGYDTVNLCFLFSPDTENVFTMTLKDGNPSIYWDIEH